jgi:hypothetical protein
LPKGFRLGKVFFLFQRKMVALPQVFVLKYSDSCRAGKLHTKNSGQSRVFGNTCVVTVQIVRQEQNNYDRFIEPAECQITVKNRQILTL